MASALVVDDSPLDRVAASRLLAEVGYEIFAAANGDEAITILEREAPDLVVTDIQMPAMDGLTLVREINQKHPATPVILMTAFGSEETAVLALKSGAASYVPKQNLARDLVRTARDVLSVARARRETRTILDSMTRLDSEYLLSNSIEGLDALIGHIKDQLKQMKLFGDADILRISTALFEGLMNAIEHGNLELRSSDRTEDGAAYRRLVEERALRPPYRKRHIHLQVSLSRQQARFRIRDEGPGFDPSTLPDPTLPENVDRTNGRGLFLIRMFMDQVDFNATGNEMTMTKQRSLQ